MRRTLYIYPGRYRRGARSWRGKPSGQRANRRGDRRGLQGRLHPNPCGGEDGRHRRLSCAPGAAHDPEAKRLAHLAHGIPSKYHVVLFCHIPSVQLYVIPESLISSTPAVLTLFILGAPAFIKHVLVYQQIFVRTISPCLPVGLTDMCSLLGCVSSDFFSPPCRRFCRSAGE